MGRLPYKLDEDNQPKKKNKSKNLKGTQLPLNPNQKKRSLPIKTPITPDLNLQNQFTTYNILAFTLEFRKQIMSCKEENEYKISQEFERYCNGKKQNQITKEQIDEFQGKLEQRKKDQKEFILFELCENIKLQIGQFYKDRDPKIKELEFSILDKLYQNVLSQNNYQFNEQHYQNLSESVVIKPNFWYTLCQIMLCEKQNKIYPLYFEYVNRSEKIVQQQI